jgi:uncharacterized protein YecT (DUF1311 family)
MSIRLLLTLLLLPLTACGGVQPNNATAEQKNSNAVRNSMCPDDPNVDLEDCKFAAAIAPLKSKGTAVTRFKAVRCGEYDQTTVNFCVGVLSAFAETELKGALERARSNSALKDLAASQSRWSRNSTKSCLDKYEGSQGGSGYASFITFCEIDLTARRIDELSGSLPKVDK